jgi:hypothetical protein
MREFFQTGRTPAAAIGIAAFSDNLNGRVSTPYSHHAMVTISREVSSAMIGATLFTVQGRSILLHTPNLNAVQTGTLPGGKPMVTGRRIAALGDFFVQDSIGESRYRGLTLDARLRSTANMSFRAAYTLARARSNGDSLANLADLPEGPSLEDEWAPSRQHVEHRLTAAATVAAPERWRPLSGVRLTGIATVESGRRFTVFAGSDINGDGNPNSDRPGTLPRNSLEGPGYATIDFRVSKRTRIAGSVGLEATVDIFNAFNRVNVKDLNTVWGSGDVSLTPPPQFAFATPRDVFNPRQIQLGLRIDFP